jgi:hypothetical protein
VSRRWGALIGLAALTLLVARAAHGDEMRLAQAWPATTTPPPPEPDAPAVGPRVTLRVDNQNGRLQQHTPLMWRDVCIAPCGVTVDPLALYRVGGGTALSSQPFKLPRPSGEVVVDAQVASKVNHWVGLGLMIGGVVAAGYGLAVWKLFNTIPSNSASYDSGAEDVRSFARTVGIVFISVGAVLELVGLPMFFNSTSVEVR